MTDTGKDGTLVEQKPDQTDQSETPPETVNDSGTAEDAQRVAEIISRGQRTRPGAGSTFMFSVTSAILLWLSFTPVDWGPLAWVSLVPFLCLTRLAQPTRWMYRIVFLVGLGYWLATLQWMRLGDPTMYIAMFALAGYLACYWPLFLWLCRTAVHRYRIPLLFAAPIYWTGLEYLRAHLFTGFAWYMLGHSQYRWVEVIQISDLVGAYGITFLIVLANAALATLIPAWFLRSWHLCWPMEEESIVVSSPRLQRGGVVLAVGLVLLSCSYGWMRRSQGTFPLGPRVALIQGNFVASVRNNLNDPREIFMMHRQLTGLTVSEQPDLIVWPEAMFPYGMYQVEQGVTDEQLKSIAPEVPVDVWRNGESQKALTDLADMTNAALVIGVSTFVAKSASYAIYNSAVLVQPAVGVTNRYDKIHRVPFGEYIPLRDVLPFLQSFTPFRGKFGIDQGKHAHVFRYQDWQLIPIICFEDTVPQLVRQIAKSAQVNSKTQNQVFVNLTNDGWFHGSSELDQHLITSQFRAIETRTPLVRAVNTGISAVIDGDGVVREALKYIDAGPREEDQPLRDSMRDPRTGRLHKQLNCAIVADVPLDPRTSWYVTLGDWFAAICLAGCVIASLSGLFSRRTFSVPT